MSFDFHKFCDDHGIQHITEGHKHCRPGWIQIACPFCSGNPGWHLGFEEGRDRLHCWRCGGKRTLDLIMKLLGVPLWRSQQLFRQYKGRPKARAKPDIQPHIRKARKLNLPVGTKPMTGLHRSYLQDRLFDPDKLEKLWKLQGTGLVGPYKFRIIAPIYHEGKLVAYQGRDITGLSQEKYKACPGSEQIINIKHTLYGLDQAVKDSVVIVEGITDVWRLGPGSVATFGITYKQEQVRLLKRYTNRYVMFDPGDPQAVEQAEEMAAELSAFSGSVEILTLDRGDPADMPQDEADQLMKDLLP